MSGMIKCEICGEEIHLVRKHLSDAHPHITEEEYRDIYPDAPLMSEALREKAATVAADRKKQVEHQQKIMAKIIPLAQPGMATKKPMFEVFELPLDESVRTAPKRGQTEGDPIMIDVVERTSLSAEDQELIPEVDEGYVFRVEELKNALMALQLRIPLLLWGMHGTGKTTQIEQILARTNRPWVRVQHTDTTEEAHIVGQMVVRNGATEFDFGPLALAMLHGWAYVADEYDFAHPAVIAVYQPILEGKPLYIKEAPPSQRMIKPHPNFRFIATGNTNGSGDDTGLYSGTKIGNAAAYSRFGVTIQVHYPEQSTEIAILRQRLGLTQEIAETLVDFATSVRSQYQAGEISLPISPRELINAAMIGMVKGAKFRQGIELAYSNRLSPTEAEAVSQMAQRLFGN